MDRDELQRVIKSPKTPMLEVIVASIVAKAATGSDHQRLDFLLTRLIGKVPDEPVEIHHLNFNMMPRHEVIALGQEAIAFLQRMTGDKDGDK